MLLTDCCEHCEYYRLTAVCYRLAAEHCECCRLTAVSIDLRVALFLQACKSVHMEQLLPESAHEWVSNMAASTGTPKEWNGVSLLTEAIHSFRGKMRVGPTHSEPVCFCAQLYYADVCGCADECVCVHSRAHWDRKIPDLQQGTQS